MKKCSHWMRFGLSMVSPPTKAMGRHGTSQLFTNMALVQLIEKVSRLLPSRFSASPPPAETAQDPEYRHRQAVGSWGEEQACRHLRQNGYRVLRRNYRARHGGEVDIVARHKPSSTLCFIEVKTRKNEDFGRPAQAVDAAKQRLIVRGALSWLRLLDNPDVRFRFDIIEVLEGPPIQIEHLEGAFQLPDNIFY
jgi:putative endonuclease